MSIEGTKSELQSHFTRDAWEQFEQYLDNLGGKFKEFSIPQDLARKTIEGILDYVKGYIQELDNRALINFAKALELITDLGSPSEVIQDMELPPVDKENIMVSPTMQPVDTGKHCVECGWKLETNVIYCQNCGKNSSIPERVFSPVKQWIIDRPNTAGILIAALAIVAILSLIGVWILIGALRNAQDGSIGPSTSIEVDGGFIFLLAIFVVISGFVLGYFIDSIYGEYRSFKSRYNKLAESIETNYTIATLLLVLAFFVYAIVIGNTSSLTEQYSLPLTFFVLLGLPISYIITLLLNDRGKYSEISYMQLLQIKRTISDRGSHKIINFNKYFIPALILASPSWHYLIYLNLKDVILLAAIPGTAFFFIALTIGNCVFYAREYSWKTLIKEIS